MVVSDPAILPAIIGRPGLPKWAAYQNVVPVIPAAAVCIAWCTNIFRPLLQSFAEIDV